jgi:hypothetical protein
MSGGWEVGDLALCIDDSQMLCSSCGITHTGELSPKKGEIERVVFLGLGLGTEGECQSLTLAFSNHRIGLASRFRKIKPDAEPCEEEFTALIKRMKPAKAPEVTA